MKAEQHYTEYKRLTQEAETILNRADFPSKYETPEKGSRKYELVAKFQEIADAAQIHYSAYLSQKQNN